MLMDWTKHITDPKEKEDYRASLKHSWWILDRQTELLNDMEERLGYKEINPKVYDTPNWSEKQAHMNGYRQCLNNIKALNYLDHKEPND